MVKITMNFFLLFQADSIQCPSENAQDATTELQDSIKLAINTTFLMKTKTVLLAQPAFINSSAIYCIYISGGRHFRPKIKCFLDVALYWDNYF